MRCIQSERRRERETCTGGEEEVDERGAHLGRVVATVAGVARGGVGGEVILGAADGAVPGPAVERAEQAEVGEAGLAAREEVALGAGGRRGAALICGRERSDGDAPRDAAGLVERGVGGEAGEARAHRHCRRADLGLWIWRRDERSQGSSVSCAPRVFAV